MQLAPPRSDADDERPRGPGRPRTWGHDERILEAVGALVDGGVPVTVNAVVEKSGVSRAAVYRRWPSMPDLVAAALDQGRSAIVVDTSGDIKEAIVELLFHDQRQARGVDYSDRRFRTRLALVMENPQLQRAYWESHVRRRRESFAAALRVAIERGELRADLDIEASIDAINGVFYYQSVVRGCRFDDPEAQARCRAAFELLWRGMTR